MPLFQRRHYEKLAEALATSRPALSAPDERHAQWLADCRSLLDTLAYDNRHFKRDRFWQELIGRDAP